LHLVLKTANSRAVATCITVMGDIGDDEGDRPVAPTVSEVNRSKIRATGRR
jgi:hypothetical protein